MSTQTTDHPEESRTFRVTGHVRFAGAFPASGTRVAAFDRDLRIAQPPGESQANRSGAYREEYSARQFLNLERGSADLVVKALDAASSTLVTSRLLFKAPGDAEIELTIPFEQPVPPTLVERIGSAIGPLEPQRCSLAQSFEVLAG